MGDYRRAQKRVLLEDLAHDWKQDTCIPSTLEGVCVEANQTPGVSISRGDTKLWNPR